MPMQDQAWPETPFFVLIHALHYVGSIIQPSII